MNPGLWLFGQAELVPFTAGELAFIAVYLACLIGVGLVGYFARRENSMRDFYLAGRGIGLVVLLLTLYATQYSGNTLFGFTGESYRRGFFWTVSVHFMTAIVVFYLLLAPKLYRLSQRHNFITPSDFVDYRFRSPALSVVVTLLMTVAIANFLLAQLMAMGRALEGLTTVNPAVAYTCGIIVLALIIVIYETLGGLRAVAWTDVIQGFILMIGFLIMICLVFQQYGSLASATAKILADEQQSSRGATDLEEGTAEQPRPPAKVSKLAPPGVHRSLEWMSYILLVGIGGALYPQAIQRIYAARSETTLRRSLAVMAFLPFSTVLIALLVGIIALAYLPDLITQKVDTGGSLTVVDNADTTLSVICRGIQESSLFGRWLVAVLFAGILAAIMSTADSVLLSISSMLTKDIYGKFWRPAATDAELTKLGKILSWGLIVILVALAILLRGTTLVQLMDRKFDLLVQLAPVFFLGLHWKRLHAGPTLLGIAAGVSVALYLAYFVGGKPFGIHPGLYGLSVNLMIAVIGSCWLARAGRRSDTTAG